MILPAALVLVLLTVPLTGGKFRRMGELRLRGGWLIITAIMLQIGAANVLPDYLPYRLLTGAHLLSYALAAAAVLVNLRPLRGLWVVALGGAMNAAAIFANGGVMPARLGALRLAGMSEHLDGFANSGAVPDPKLALLGDVFAVPEPVPLANVFSVGDVVLVAGFALIVHWAARGRAARPD